MELKWCQLEKKMIFNTVKDTVQIIERKEYKKLIAYIEDMKNRYFEYNEELKAQDDEIEMDDFHRMMEETDEMIAIQDLLAEIIMNFIEEKEK